MAVVNILGMCLWCYACLFANKHRGKLVMLALLLMVVR